MGIRGCAPGAARVNVGRADRRVDARDRQISITVFELQKTQEASITPNSSTPNSQTYVGRWALGVGSYRYCAPEPVTNKSCVAEPRTSCDDRTSARSVYAPAGRFRNSML